MARFSPRSLRSPQAARVAVLICALAPGLAGCRGDCPSGAAPRRASSEEGTEATCVDAAGLRQGPWRKWYDDGQLAAEGAAKDDKDHGPVAEWWPNGKIKSRGEMKDGQHEGPWRTWHDNDELASEATMIAGKPEGWVRTWDFRGQPFTEVFWRDGKKDGTWKVWHDGGGLTRLDTYRAGVLHGPYARWKPSGELIERGEYVQGSREGTWLVAADGQPPRERSYAPPSAPSYPRRELGGVEAPLFGPALAASPAEWHRDAPLDPHPYLDHPAVPNTSLYLFSIPDLVAKGARASSIDCDINFDTQPGCAALRWRSPLGGSGYFALEHGPKLVVARGASLRRCRRLENPVGEDRRGSTLEFRRGDGVLSVPLPTGWNFPLTATQVFNGGRSAVVASDHRVAIIRDLGDPLFEPVLGLTLGAITTIAADPDSSTVFVATWHRGDFPGTSTLTRLDPDMGAGVLNLTDLGPNGPRHFYFLPETRVLAYKTYEGPLLIIDADTGVVRHRIEAGVGAKLALGPGGGVTLGDSVVDVDHGTLAPIAPALRPRPPRITTPDGRYLIYTDQTPTAGGELDAQLVSYDLEEKREVARVRVTAIPGADRFERPKLHRLMVTARGELLAAAGEAVPRLRLEQTRR